MSDLMPIVRIDSFVEFYRHLASGTDIHSLSGSGGDEVAATEFTSRRILDALRLLPYDTLLDVGCGDGSLLALAGDRLAVRVGIVPTVEEQTKLREQLPHITFQVAFAESLPLESEAFSKVVCNSVLLLLPSEGLVRQALKQIARVARPNALIWLGEIPACDELSRFGKYKGHSVGGFLWHSLQKDGPKAFLTSAKDVLICAISARTLVLHSANIFYAQPERFISMAQECGLRLVSHFKHQRLDRSGKILESPYRYDYLFVK